MEDNTNFEQEIQEITLEELSQRLSEFELTLNSLIEHNHDGKKSPAIDFKTIRNTPEFKHDDLPGAKNLGEKGHVRGGDKHDHKDGRGGTISHDDLSGKGKYPHSAIDKHLEEKNPHGTTAEEIKALSLDGGKIKSKKKAALILEREDLGTILEMISKGEQVLEVSDKGVFLKIPFKALELDAKRISAESLNGVNIKELLQRVDNISTAAGAEMKKHLSNKNPHNIKLEDLGGLSKNGGKITGALEIKIEDNGIFSVAGKDGKIVLLIRDDGSVSFGKVGFDHLAVKSLEAEKIGNMILKDGKLSHDELSGTGNTSHDDIDKHIADSNNPHGVTLEQIMKDTAIKSNMIERKAIKSDHIDNSAVKLSHLDSEVVKKLSPDKLIDLINETKLDNQQLVQMIVERVASMRTEILNEVDSRQPEIVVQALEAPQQPQGDYLPKAGGSVDGWLGINGGAVKFKYEKHFLNIEGIKGIMFQVGDSIVAITNDGLLINGKPWVNKQETTVVQESAIDEAKLLEKVLNTLGKNMSKMKDDTKQEIISEVMKALNAQQGKINDYLEQVASELNSNIKQSIVSSASAEQPVSIIDGDWFRVENGKLIIQSDVIQFVSKHIKFNNTAEIEEDGDITTEGKVCGIDLGGISLDGTIDHDKLKNSGKRSHIELDKHIALKTNPHETRMMQMSDGESAMKRISDLEAQVSELKEIIKNLKN